MFAFYRALIGYEKLLRTGCGVKAITRLLRMRKKAEQTVGEALYSFSRYEVSVFASAGWA